MDLFLLNILIIAGSTSIVTVFIVFSLKFAITDSYDIGMFFSDDC